MAVTKSSFSLVSTLDRVPLFRLDYRDDMRTAPSAHWQVTAERGHSRTFSPLVGMTDPTPSAPCIFQSEGRECARALRTSCSSPSRSGGVDHQPNYRVALNEGRERWRRRQLAAMVRDVPEEAVRVLADLGYAIDEPPDGCAPVRHQTLTDW